jgi:phosphate transport system ATP-binding protein
MWYGQRQALQDISIRISARKVTAIIGPSGCGKSTFLRALNRMHELTPGTRIDRLASASSARTSTAPADRCPPSSAAGRHGLPEVQPFPTMSIAENVLVGLRLNGVPTTAPS